ncbi:MAG: hypothetical protein AAB383_02625 [Patescibacteria group bacterium]
MQTKDKLAERSENFFRQKKGVVWDAKLMESVVKKASKQMAEEPYYDRFFRK